MKKGGTRKLIVPSKYGYGKRGCAPDIPGGATLHFLVTMKQIKRQNEMNE
jgi:FKBP-type peptidyl-prolyl cis-trans isomerase